MGGARHIGTLVPRRLPRRSGLRMLAGATLMLVGATAGARAQGWDAAGSAVASALAGAGLGPADKLALPPFRDADSQALCEPLSSALAEGLRDFLAAIKDRPLPAVATAGETPSDPGTVVLTGVWRPVTAQSRLELRLSLSGGRLAGQQPLAPVTLEPGRLKPGWRSCLFAVEPLDRTISRAYEVVVLAAPNEDVAERARVPAGESFRVTGHLRGSFWSVVERAELRGFALGHLGAEELDGPAQALIEAVERHGDAIEEATRLAAEQAKLAQDLVTARATTEDARQSAALSEQAATQAAAIANRLKSEASRATLAEARAAAEAAAQKRSAAAAALQALEARTAPLQAELEAAMTVKTREAAAEGDAERALDAARSDLFLRLVRGPWRVSGEDEVGCGSSVSENSCREAAIEAARRDALARAQGQLLAYLATVPQLGEAMERARTELVLRLDGEEVAAATREGDQLAVRLTANASGELVAAAAEPASAESAPPASASLPSLPPSTEVPQVAVVPPQPVTAGPTPAGPTPAGPTPAGPASGLAPTPAPSAPPAPVPSPTAAPATPAATFDVEPRSGEWEVVQPATVRTIPKSDGPRLTSLVKGRKVTVTGKLKGGNWVRVETPAGAGWVFGSALREGPSVPTEDTAFWRSIENSRDPADYEAYLRNFPGGRFIAAARERLAQIANPQPERPPTDGKWSGSVTNRTGFSWAIELEISNGNVVGNVRCTNPPSGTASPGARFQTRLGRGESLDVWIESLSFGRRRLTGRLPNLYLYPESPCGDANFTVNKAGGS